MPEPRPAASLTSGLLARRGDARPAMRRQPIAHLHVPLAAQDDLGWNDIGETPVPPPTSLAGLTPPGGVARLEPVAEHRPEEIMSPAPAPEPVTPPPASSITRRLEAIAERMGQNARAPAFRPMIARKADARIDAGAVPQAQAAVVRKAAFTLRLEPERHLRLRLLSAVTHRSAQQLLTEALDALLAGHDQVEHLAGQVETGTEPNDRAPGLARQG